MKGEKRLDDLQHALAQLEQQRAELVAEIQELRAATEAANVPEPGTGVFSHSPEADKIHLFRSLFAGRNDVFPRRFESRKNGRSGYQPACKNEWRAGVCFKPKIKCAACEYREFIPVSDKIVRQHLSGKDTQQGKPFVMGVYPLKVDESCSFLAVDFDKVAWREDALAFLNTCDQLDIPAYLERSRSGNGGHIWMFFAESLAAVLARKFGSFILTKAMNDRPELGFDSYDRFFPNQDRMPAGGFGNLIALPLQKQARESGNSVFIDRNFIPFADQWAFLSKVRKIEKNRAEEVVRNAEKRDLILGVRTVPDEENKLPWLMPPSRTATVKISGKHPETIEIVSSNELYIPKSGLSPSLRNAILRLAAFRNPEFYKAQAIRLPVFNIPRIIACAEEFPDHIGLPRGCEDELIALLKSLNINVLISDQRTIGKALSVSFCGQLRGEQTLAGKVLMKYDTGLSATLTRRDGQHPIVFMQCGPIRYKTNDKKHAAQRPFDHKVVARYCLDVVFPERDELPIANIYRLLAESDDRNRRIAEDIVMAFKEGRSPLVLTERTCHLELLRELLSPEIDRMVVLKGGLGKKKMKEINSKLSDWKNLPHVILATGRYLGEGFDDSRLDTLFLALPVSWRGIISQYAGRLHRLHDSKCEVRIYDYVDQGNPVLARMFERRIKGYEAIGYSLASEKTTLL